ncbi:MAG: hydantoinase/oxoprolinase family protein [Reyranellales bacterium]
MTKSSGDIRLGVDIGGTFTDIAIEIGSRYVTTKVLTTPRAPEQAVMQGIAAALAEAQVEPGAVELVIHGTTLATNALIERKGARTAMIGTEGHRDTLELGYEDRFSEYDVFIEKPAALIPRDLRFTVPERMSAKGEVLRPLDEAAVAALAPDLKQRGVESVAVGFLHAYANPDHERRVRAILAKLLPGLTISLSSEVCAEVREYDRFSTTACNAYVQPLMAGYLDRLGAQLRAAGFKCPLYLMLSGGGLATLETAMRFPIRLVESGPAGGAILAAGIAAESELPRVLSFDMGGTTAKICLIDDYRPQASRSFEIGRIYRFLKGSGLPVRIPVIEMVEIGAGGGSIASVDLLKRLRVGPESAGAEPGPASYGRGGTAPTVTDADLALGRIDSGRFAGGTLALDAAAARAALERDVGARLGLNATHSAYGVSEMVDENMANAARVHAIERGKTLADRTLIAFGGAAPLHAARLAEKLGMTRIVIPTSAGVGSAVGFLRAPVAYEVVRSRFFRLGAFEPDVVNAMLREMQTEARDVVAKGAPGTPIEEHRHVEMRYIGQGHEIPVTLPLRDLGADDAGLLRRLFEERYAEIFGRAVPGVEVEILAWSIAMSASTGVARPIPPLPAKSTPAAHDRRQLFDGLLSEFKDVPVHWRDELAPGSTIAGPAVIAEAQTATVVSATFDARIDRFGNIVLERRAQGTTP